MQRIQTIWNTGHELLIARVENLSTEEEKCWEESVLRAFSSDDSDVGQQLCNHIHGTAQPEFVQAMDNQSNTDVIAQYGQLVNAVFRQAVHDNRSKYRELGVARLIHLYKNFLAAQLVRYHAHP